MSVLDFSPGGGIDYWLTPKFEIRLGADYNSSSVAKGGVACAIQLTAPPLAERLDPTDSLMQPQ
jgi:hypothetical protein